LVLDPSANETSICQQIRVTHVLFFKLQIQQNIAMFRAQIPYGKSPTKVWIRQPAFKMEEQTSPYKSKRKDFGAISFGVKHDWLGNPQTKWASR
jgi:hypothetical protein